jgi:transcriptional regulator with XRE-family HTH domain
MNKKQIGALLRKKRTAKGWSVNRAATESGVRGNQIKSIESADSAYVIDTLMKLAEAYGAKLMCVDVEPIPEKPCPHLPA